MKRRNKEIKKSFLMLELTPHPSPLPQGERENNFRKNWWGQKGGQYG
jgi:hypothetical protein